MREGPPFDPAAFGLARHTVYLSPHEVVFLFEAPDADVHVADIVDDMAVSASFAAWAPLLSGTPRLAHQAYCWEEAPRALGVR